MTLTASGKIILGSEQYGTELYVKQVNEKGHNLCLEVTDPKTGIIALFRFSYLNRARSNARYPDYRVMNVYLESITHEHGIELKHITDFCLRIERCVDWLFEGFMRERGY